MAVLLKSDGTVEEITPKNGKDFKLAECYTLLECDTIEIIYLKSPDIMIIDEEGKCKDFPILNYLATIKARPYLSENDFVVGHAIICKSKELK